MPRRGDETFSELANRTPRRDLSERPADELVAEANNLVESRLTIAVHAGMILAELLDRGYTVVQLQRLTTLHRRGIARWAEPFRREIT